MPAYNRNHVRDLFRLCVLKALDTAARQFTFNPQSGWVDGDLPAVFSALDAQIERIAARHDITLLEPVSEESAHG